MGRSNLRCCVTPVTQTGAAQFSNRELINKAFLLATAPSGAKLVGVDITVRAGAPRISGSLAAPPGGSVVTANAVYGQSWSSREQSVLGDFQYQLSAGDVVDVFWTVEL